MISFFYYYFLLLFFFFCRVHCISPLCIFGGHCLDKQKQIGLPLCCLFIPKKRLCAALKLVFVPALPGCASALQVQSSFKEETRQVVGGAQETLQLGFPLIGVLHPYMLLHKSSYFPPFLTISQKCT